METTTPPPPSSSSPSPSSSPLALDDYRLFGRSGLRVSPLSLGAMTFGRDWGWGADVDVVQQIVDRYIERGGNVIDTANFYTNGTSEEIVGRSIAGRRERLVLATKYSLFTRAGDPNSGGNSRKTMVRAVEDSLRRLGTDFIDLFYLHAWDDTTPVDEVMRGLDDLVRAGKVVYVGISDTPAWQVARMQTLADLRGWAPLIALQIEYSLIERTVERELIPMAAALGLGVTPWSPLGGGVLTGKYRTNGANSTAPRDDGSRRALVENNGALTERNAGIADVVVAIAAELGRTPAQVALAWTLLNPTVTSPILGVRTLAQLDDNLGALDVVFDDDQRRRLDEVSAIVAGFPHDFLAWAPIRHNLTGGARIRRR
ncbi:MAG TPA: aldo/keto reductase [Myxococcota bacterium]